MEEKILNEIYELKKLTLLSAKPALNIDDVAALTGLSKGAIYKMTCAKKIPHYKSQGGKLLFFKKEDISNWMLSQRVASDDEMMQNAMKRTI